MAPEHDERLGKELGFLRSREFDTGDETTGGKSERNRKTAGRKIIGNIEEYVDDQSG
jgi:hypothetical protein